MITIKKLIFILILPISLCSVGCSQDALSGEGPNKIIIKDTQGKQVEIINKKEIENFNYMLKYEDWKELNGIELDFNPDISIVEEYKSSKSKSREMCFNKDSKNIKLIIDGKYTTLYEVEVEVYDEIYDSISTILYNDSKVN